MGAPRGRAFASEQWQLLDRGAAVRLCCGTVLSGWGGGSTLSVDKALGSVLRIPKEERRKNI